MKPRRRMRLVDFDRNFDARLSAELASLSRSRLAHVVVRQRRYDRLGNLVESQRLRKLAVPAPVRDKVPVRGKRLAGLSPFTYEPMREKHATKESMRRCVNGILSDYRVRVGSGTGARKSRKSRAQSRRELFAAARKTC